MVTQMNMETFLFGVATGIATVASIQYIVGLFTRPSQHLKRSPSERFERTERVVKDKDIKILPSPGVHSVLATLDAQMVVSSSRLQKLVLHMVSEFKKGLSSDNEIFKMIPSFVVSRPTGNEKGTFLALDLGGTNFRVCKVNLEGHGSMRMSHAKYTVSDELKQGPGEKLFDFFAECVSLFCKDQGIEKATVVPMGFTFSFPVHQTAINRGSLVKWTKGFSAAGVEGHDVVELLEQAFKRKGLNINIKAIVNDTVGTLIAHSYADPHTYIAVILGTGTNAAYVEKAINIKKWNSDDGEVIINTEWGAYDEPSVLPISAYDLKLDRQSLNPKKQIFEKMISGMYLGELTRLVIVDLIKSGELFGGRGSSILEKKNAFETAHMSRVERDHSLSLADTKQLFEDVFDVLESTLEDRRIIKHVCELVGTRAARLSAAGIAALVTKINRLDACTVAIDGSVFEHYPHFGNRMRDTLHELLGITAENIVLEQARDGSGQGAALIAALH